ncbi:MAG: GDP-mannose 4,6-dehydratase [Candidatus Curtissbacteria bacterium]|nr:GDP-mannose 4,6-dehydratase [Candidatus Curtissbacteria bacterium]
MKKALNSARNQGSSKKVLITGVAGFVGSHLTKYLIAQNFKVVGFFHPLHSTENISSLKDKLELVACDILNYKQVEEEIAGIKPDYVFHLAAFSSPSQSLQNPRQTLENNIFGQINILDSLVKIKSNAKILIVGSADEYGNVDKKDLPVKEDHPLSPGSPYAVSKVAQDMLGYQYFLNYGLNIVRVRPSNHIGPRQAPVFVVSAFASQIAVLEKQGGGIMKVGNLESERDFTDVGDMVKAYLLALDRGKIGEVYNIGSGKVIKIGKILEIMLSQVHVKITPQKDNGLFRPTEVFYSDPTKFKKQTGWQPTIPIKTTLFDTINYEREKLKV